MQLFLVTSLATEQNPVGDILKAMCRVHAICTTREQADAYADKYNGSVSEFYSDKDSAGRVVLEWENPGYAAG